MIKTRKKRYIVALAVVAALLAAFLAYTADYYRAGMLRYCCGRADTINSQKEESDTYQQTSWKAISS